MDVQNIAAMLSERALGVESSGIRRVFDLGARLENPINFSIGQPDFPVPAEVLGLLSEGLPNKQIALRLHISEHTVKFHIASIFAKLGAASRTEAVSIGARQGLITL